VRGRGGGGGQHCVIHVGVRKGAGLMQEGVGRAGQGSESRVHMHALRARGVPAASCRQAQNKEEGCRAEAGG
jgi:hypothetical protein